MATPILQATGGERPNWQGSGNPFSAARGAIDLVACGSGAEAAPHGRPTFSGHRSDRISRGPQLSY
jgi:hypothetical protein